MNRRQFLGLSAAAMSLRSLEATAGMPKPVQDRKAHKMNVRTGLSGENSVARVWFGFDRYEELLASQRERTPVRFSFEGKAWTLRVTHLSVDVFSGGVYAIVDGAIR